MNVVTPEPSAVHRAALSLHALGDADRAWVLQGLPAGQQLVLRRLLDELKAIGVAQDARLFEAIVQRPGSCSAPPPPGLREADAQQIVRLLEGEPPRVIAALLASGDLPWLASRLARATAEGDPAAPQAPAPGSALQAAVRAELERLLAAQRPEREAPSLWRRVRQGLQLRGSSL